MKEADRLAYKPPVDDSCARRGSGWAAAAGEGGTLDRDQGRSDGGISVYIPPKSVYLKFFMRLFCLLDPGQIEIVMTS